MRLRPIYATALLMLSGCAFKAQVQRFGVEYNEALASMANEQTLLNILRTSKGMPTHFTAVSRFTGALSVKATGSLNGQLRGSGLTRTATTGSSATTATTVGTSTAPAGFTSTNSVVTTPVTSGSVVEAVAEGVDLYTPQVGGELNSGTTFDVQVFDQQKFYQGILGAVPFPTVEMLINQGFEPDLVATLLIGRIDIYVEDTKVKGKKVGDAVASIRNEQGDRIRFQRFIDCNALDVAEYKAPSTKITPISRLGLGTVAGKTGVTLEQLAIFDGDKFGLSEQDGISADGSTDALVYIVKPGAKSRIPRLVARSCGSAPFPLAPAAYATEAVYLGNGQANVADNSGSIARIVKTPVVFELVFRSPEAIIRAVGEAVRLRGKAGAPSIGVCPTGGTDCSGIEKLREPLFVLKEGRDRGSLATARFMNTDYSIPADGFRSMQVISIVQQLVNLQKESSERALSVPVRAVP